VSRAGQEAADKVANTEVAKKTIKQRMNIAVRLAGATVKNFRVGRANKAQASSSFQ